MQKFLSIVAVMFVTCGCSPMFIATYSTDCQVDKSTAVARLQRIAAEISSKVGAPARVTSSHPLELEIPLPLVLGEQSHDGNSSGKIVLSEYGSGFTVGFNKPGGDNDSYAAHLKNIIEDALTHNSCKPWTYKQQIHTFELG